MPQKKVFRDSDSEDEEDLEAKEEAELCPGKDDLLMESDSDSSPEDVAFADSRKSALQQVKDTLKVIDAEKKKKKLKRHAREEQFAIQKKQKIEALSKSRLPDDVLEALSSKPLKVGKKKETKSSEDETVSLLEQQEEAGSEEENEESGQDYSGDDDDEETSFIPLDRSTNITAVYLREELKKTMSSSQKAAEFRNNRMFGSKVQREPVSEVLAKKTKRRARFL